MVLTSSEYVQQKPSNAVKKEKVWVHASIVKEWKKKKEENNDLNTKGLLKGPLSRQWKAGMLNKGQSVVVELWQHAQIQV